MKNFYLKYQSNDLWCIKENDFREDLQKIRESQFAIGNGFIGSRGTLEEKPRRCLPGTYLAGVYDRLTAQVSELVNLPNPFHFKINAFGQKIGITAMNVASHQRILDMKNGLITRHTVYSDNQKRRYDYQSLRFLSMDARNVGVMQIVLTPLDSDTELQVQTGVDTTVFNSGVVTEGNKRHFSIRELSRHNNADSLVVKTLEKKYCVIFKSGFCYKIGKRSKVYASENVLTLRLKKGERIIFTSLFYLDFSTEDGFPRCEKNARRTFTRVFRSNFKSLLRKHIDAWQELWDKADIVIEGTSDIQKNVRFNIYHLLICSYYDGGFSSIGARTLSGEGYRGHIFWDSEIFLLPFYAHIFPQTAKNILMYRHNRLKEAKSIAKSKGYSGVLFPWESAHNGREETPTWAKNLDGSIIRIKTNEFEQHITADIAFACYNYFKITGDKEFMTDYGYEILFECARFWVSRASKNEQAKFAIGNIMGPDEFHEKVNNNAYTNIMAKWNLLYAHKSYEAVKKNKKIYSRLRNRMNLTDKEAKKWKYIASRLGVKMKKNRVIEQFDSFFRKRYIEIVNFDENNIPLLPQEVKVKDYNKTQFVKQADVIMALYLLSESFTPRTKESNFWFYLRRTLHKSSLSAPVHALMALEVDALSRAYQFFNVALRADISNLHGNTHEGIHAASAGGVWQCIIYGFAGIKIDQGVLSVSPYMPLAWQAIKFKLLFKETLWEFQAGNKEICLKASSKYKRKLKIIVFGRQRIISPNKAYNFKAKEFIRKLPLSEKYY